MAVNVTHGVMELLGHVNMKQLTHSNAELEELPLLKLNVRSRPTGTFAEDVINDFKFQRNFHKVSLSGKPSHNPIKHNHKNGTDNLRIFAEIPALLSCCFVLKGQ